MNKCIFLGNICSEIETKTLKSGNTVADFRIAVNGRKPEETVYVSIVAWGKQAEVISNNFKKGDKIAVATRLTQRQYETKDGKKATAYDYVMESFDFCQKKG